MKPRSRPLSPLGSPRPAPAETFFLFHGPGSFYTASVFMLAGLALLLPCATVVLAAQAADRSFKAARLGFYRRRAQIDRAFAKVCAERLRDLHGASRAVYRRALRELSAERVRLEEERSNENLSGQSGAMAHRAAARARRDAAWDAWFSALERAVAGSGTPPRELLARAPGRRGAPIRRLCERSVLAPPSREELLAQWEKARGRGRVEEKIRLGSMLLDAEATVDSSLVRNGNGEIVGRRGGLREWIDETCPSLSKHYAALMGYRRLAAEFRREHGLFDPAPASLLLAESPEAERKLPPSHQAMLPRARTAARKLLAEPDLTTVRAFRARLLAMKDARAAPAAGLRRRLA